MRPHVAAAFMVVALLILLVSPASAVIILRKGESQPIRGYLVYADNIRVKYREVLPTGETRERMIPRISIDELDPAFVSGDFWLALEHDEVFLVTPEGDIVDEVVW